MTILSELNLSEFGTSGTIAAIIVVLTVLGFVKGAVKLVFLLFTLAGAGYAGYWGSEEGLIYLQNIWPTAPEQLGIVFAAICGLVTFYFLSKVFSFFTNPFENSNFIARFAFGIPAAVISLIAASGLVWVSLNFLKEKGAEGEIKYWITQDDANSESRLKNYPTLAGLKRHFEATSVGKKLANLYKSDDSEKHNLAKLLVIANTSAEKIRSLAQDERVMSVLRNPQVSKLMSDPVIRQQIAENDVQGLLANPNLKNALKEKKLLDDLISMSSEQFR